MRRQPATLSRETTLPDCPRVPAYRPLRVILSTDGRLSSLLLLSSSFFANFTRSIARTRTTPLRAAVRRTASRSRESMFSGGTSGRSLARDRVSMCYCSNRSSAARPRYSRAREAPRMHCAGMSAGTWTSIRRASRYCEEFTRVRAGEAQRGKTAPQGKYSRCHSVSQKNKKNCLSASLAVSLPTVLGSHRKILNTHAYTYVIGLSETQSAVKPRFRFVGNKLDNVLR